jgi:hypothetical protein
LGRDPISLPSRNNDLLNPIFGRNHYCAEAGGYRSTINLISMVYFIAGKLDLYPYDIAKRQIMKHLIRKVFEKMYVMSVPRRISTSLSDNQAYPQVCIQASIDYKSFNKFRRNPIYNLVLEHVSDKQGGEYLRLISDDPDILAAINTFKPNDRYGNPRMYEYPNIGMISPSTLRYIKVLVDIKTHFKTVDNLNICEIGVGYGGQCRIINAYYKPATYCLVDIQPALALAQRYLDNYVIPSVLSYKTMNELEQRKYDLVISNYAFTELPRTIQDIYLRKIIINSKMGYITYNEITPNDFNSYKADILVEIIPGATIIKEEPLTHPKNCIIVWGQNT